MIDARPKNINYNEYKDLHTTNNDKFKNVKNHQRSFCNHFLCLSTDLIQN